MLSFFEREVAHPDVTPQFTRHTSPVAPEFGRAFTEACLRNSPQSIRDLRDATAALVERLKADGLPPERVVVAIKTALVRYGGYPHPPSYDDGHETPEDEQRAKTYRCVFNWCLDAYYGTSRAIRCCLPA